MATPQNAVQHDSTYDISFYAGRGNLVLVMRYDLTDPNNTAGKATEYKYGFDTKRVAGFHARSSVALDLVQLSGFVSLTVLKTAIRLPIAPVSPTPMVSYQLRSTTLTSVW